MTSSPVELHALADGDAAAPDDVGGGVAQQRERRERYIAPVSRYVKPSASAAARATVDFPAPAGPSIATIIARSALLGSRRRR